MPVDPIHRYTCPVTGTVVYSPDLPTDWFLINGEVFAPEAKLLLAKFIMTHPDVRMGDLLANLGTAPKDPAAGGTG